MFAEFKLPIEQTIKSFLYEAKSQLSKTIALLESDEVVQQMKNDQSLYQYKLDHIRQLIKDNFNFQAIITGTISELHQLKIQNAKLEQASRRKDQEYLQEIGNIEQTCQKYIKVKEEEIRQLKNKFEGNSYLAESQARKYQNQISELKRRNAELEDQNQMNILALEKREKLSQQRIRQLQANFEREEKHYDEVIEKMKNDMHLIKSQWQKKCQQVSNNERVKYKQQLLANQQKMNKQLADYVQTLKLGKNVVIRQDDQLMRSKMQNLKEDFLNQMNKKQRRIEDLDQELQKMRIKYTEQSQRNKALNEEKLSNQMQFDANCYSYELQLQKMQSQIQSLARKASQKQSHLRTSELQCESLKSLNAKFQDQLKFTKRKVQSMEESNNQCLQQLQKVKKQKNHLQAQIESLQQKLQHSKSFSNKIEKQSEQLSKQLQRTFLQKDKSEGDREKVISVLDARLSEQQIRSKKLQQKIKKLVDILDKLHLKVKKMQKEIILFSEQAKYQIEITKTKMSNSMHHQFQEHIERYRDQLQKKFKQKMMNLIDEVEQNEKENKQHLQKVETQNRNLRQELRQYDILLDKKEKQYCIKIQKQISEQNDQIRRVMAQQISREKRINQQLQNKLRNSQMSYQRNLDSLQKTLRLKVKTFAEKWNRQLTKHDEQYKSKQKQILILNQKIKVLQQDKKRSQQLLQMQKDEVKDMRRKLDQHSHHRDDKVQDLLKRLEKQSKHKLQLEKELKQIRKQMTKFMNNQKFDSQQRDRQRNNAVYTTMRENQNKVNYNGQSHDKEKQLSELRQMIAKTYKIVGEKSSMKGQEAEKDVRYAKKPLLL